MLENGNTVNRIEALFWRNGKKHYLGLVKNPAEQKELNAVCQRFKVQEIEGEQVEIQLAFKEPF